MKLQIKDTPRPFQVGKGGSITIKDTGSICLEPNEQLTFMTPGGAETDIVRKDWGFYATGSLNGRLPEHRLRAALAVNKQDRYYIMLVEKGFEEQFKTYLKTEENNLVCWLDTKALNTIKEKCGKDIAE